MQQNEIEPLLEELVKQQRKTLLRVGRRLVPQLIDDDLWQPNDFEELETCPEFRYEEGMLAGLQAAQAALRAHRQDH